MAATQDGLFTRAQARESGAALSTIRRWITSGLVIEVYPGVLEPRSNGDSSRKWLRALSLATGAPLSHWSAALLLGLDHDATPLRDASARHGSTPLHITTARALHLNLPGVHEHQLALDHAATVEVAGIRSTSVQRTCVDLMAWLPPAHARSLAFRALQRGWLTSEVLGQALTMRKGWDGTPQLRELLVFFSRNAHSPAEWLLVPILDSLAGVRWIGNEQVRLTSGAVFVLDARIVGVKLGIEVDGLAFHSDRDRFIGDRRRQNALVADGWTILRFTWDDLQGRPAVVRALIVETLERLQAAQSPIAVSR